MLTKVQNASAEQLKLLILLGHVTSLINNNCRDPNTVAQMAELVATN